MVKIKYGIKKLRIYSKFSTWANANKITFCALNDDGDDGVYGDAYVQAVQKMR